MEDAGVTESREGSAVVVVDGSRAGRESSCEGNSRNTNSSCRSSSSTSSDSGVAGGGSVVVGDSGGGSGGSVGEGLSCRGGSPRLIIKGPVEGPASSSRVAARVHPSWGTGARGVGPSAPSGSGGCPAADGVPGRNVAEGATTRNHQPMGANLTKQSRVSSSKGVRFNMCTSVRMQAGREDQRSLEAYRKKCNRIFLGILNVISCSNHSLAIFIPLNLFFFLRNLKQCAFMK